MRKRVRRAARGRWSMIVALGVVLSGAAAGTAGAQGLADYDYEDLEFRGIGAEVGRIWPSQVEPTTSFGLRLDLGLIGPHVRIMPTARFWSSTLRAEELDNLANQIILVCERQPNAVCPETLDLGEIRLSDLEVATDAHFLFFPESMVSPYAGLTLGLHLLNGRGDFIDGTFVEDLLDAVAPGLGSVTGITVGLGRTLQVGVEARYMLASDVRYGSVGISGSWLLPTPGVDETIAFRRQGR